MGRVRFRAADATCARQAAEAALAARSGLEPRWSLGLLRALTPNAPGTHPYLVTFSAWESRGEDFVRRDVHRSDIWATDATAARRLAVREAQALPGYLPAWRVTRVERRGARRDPAKGLGKGTTERPGYTRRRAGLPPHHARRPHATP
jgi:hypothetical protein